MGQQLASKNATDKHLVSRNTIGQAITVIPVNMILMIFSDEVQYNLTLITQLY